MITKKQAIELFGGKQILLAKALGKSNSAISQWPDILAKDQSNIVLGEATRRKIKIPKELLC